METDSTDLVLAIADWAESVCSMQVQVLVCGARHTQTHSLPFGGCWLVKLVRLGQLEVKRRLGKVVVVWDRSEWPHIEALESLALAGREVVVEVMAVRSRCHLNHPALIIGLEEGGGEVRLVDSWENILTLLMEPAFLPWGMAASVKMSCSPGMRIVEGWGRGVKRTDGTVSLACLHGTPLVGLEVEMVPELVTSNNIPERPQENDRVHL